jgi:hypothetical protein
VNWTYLDEGRDRWLALLNMVPSRTIKGVEFFDWLSDCSPSEEGLCSMEIV